MKKGDKKSLSTIVATLLILLLIMVAVGIIWVVVKKVIVEGSEQVSLGKFTLDLKITRVQTIDNDTIKVKVKRNSGAGDFVGINFVFDDGDNSEVIKQNASMNEFEEINFYLNLTELNASKIKKIQIAPVFRLESGKEVIGPVKDEYVVSGGGVGEYAQESDVGQDCVDDSDCNDYYSGNFCSPATVVSKTFHNLSCSPEGTCEDSTSQIVIQDCAALGKICSGGTCVSGSGDIFNIYFSQNFEDDTLGVYDWNEWYADWNYPEWSDPRQEYWTDYGQIKIISEGGNKYLRHESKAGEWGTGIDHGMQWWVPIENVDEAYFSFKMRMPSSLFNQGKFISGKVNGLMNPDDVPPGQKTPPNSGFVAIIAFQSDEDETILFLYIYHQEMYCNSCGINCADIRSACTSCNLNNCAGCGNPYCSVTTQEMCSYCDTGAWGFDSDCETFCPEEYKLYYGNFYSVNFNFDPDRWYTLTERVVMNDEWTSNGIIEVFIDGNLIASYSGYRFRDTSDVKIEFIKIENFFGGGSDAASVRDTYFDFDNFVVFTYDSGVSGIPRGNTPSSPGRVLQLPSV